MSNPWVRLAERHGGSVTVDDLTKAAHRLNTMQVIYAADHGCRASYDLITTFLAEFRQVFEPLGRELLHRPHHGYVMCTSDLRIGPRLGLTATRMGVVLRRLYDEKMTRADIENGQVVVDLVELQQAWQDYLGMEWKFRQGDLEDVLKTLRKHSVVLLRDTGDSATPFEVIVRSAIEDVLGERVLHSLASYGYAGDDAEDDDEAA